MTKYRGYELVETACGVDVWQGDEMIEMTAGMGAARRLVDSWHNAP